MEYQKSTYYHKLVLLLLVVLLLLLTGCKIDLSNEIWLNPDASGKALIQAKIEFSDFGGEMDINEFLEKNALQGYIELVKSTPGAELISEDIIDKSDADNIRAIYKVEFKFDKVTTLNKILARQNETAYELKKNKKRSNLIINPIAMSMIDQGDMKEVASDMEGFETNLTIDIHTPRKVIETDAINKSMPDEKTVRMHFILNSSWYKNPDKQITVKY